MSRIRSSNTLQVGFNEAKPWSYTSIDGVLGRDIDTCRALATSLGAQLHLVEYPHTGLAAAVFSGEVQLAVGGLINQGCMGIACIGVQRGRYVDTGLAGTLHYRRAFFPNMWWIRERDLAWNLQIRAFLLARHLREAFPILAGDSCFQSDRREP